MGVRRIIYFVRHGERLDLLQAEKLDREEEVQVDKNALLSDFGKTQSFVTGMHIARSMKNFPKDSKVIIMSSPYLRCLQTAFQIMLGLKMEGFRIYEPTIFYTDFLKEFQNEKTKMTKQEMQTEFKKLQLPESILIQPGGDQLPFDVTKESPGLSFARTRVFLDKLSRPNLEIGNIKPDVIICVTHSFWFINLLFMHELLMEAYGLIDYCSYCRVIIMDDGKTVVDMIKKHSHLDKLDFVHKL